MRYVFCRMFCAGDCQDRKLQAKIRLQFGNFVVKFIGDSMFTLPDDQKVDASVGYVDAKGNAAKVDGAPVWTSSDPAVLNVVAATDGMSATITPVGPLGTAQVKIEADADLGAGVVSLITLADVEIVAGSAVAGNVVFGAPVPL